MDLNKLTEKSQEALAQAQSIAVEHGHQEVDGEHLALSMLQQEDGLVPRLLKKMDVNAEALERDIVRALERRPRVSGPGATPGSIFVSQRLNKILLGAEKHAKKMKDEYISLEHFVMAFLDEGDKSDVGKLLKTFGVTSDRFLSALLEIRGNQRTRSCDRTRRGNSPRDSHPQP